ncbi:MarR family transcriptional regulator [Paenibacillus chondroitinus]|uniref:MarR family transcriptional regulator n=1 Tax=Paenibacillus chondroitinus TaxID=59842 RepID=A0ABU6DJX6_9BACL|nr:MULTISPECIES: MarR family transcriptional regulator [Paenibacillus]MCY9661348.1 MarR family transcriptional regulator [Paenibacillus anseongense]MEB4798089.1 MarR family transcriptional regulator [Paenibacillus chondroitinus]
MDQDLLITYKFREIKNALSSYLTQVLPHFHISPIMMYALEFLRKHPDCIAVDIANEFGLTRGAITQLLDKLEEQELVIRKPHPTSRRSLLLQVTDKGNKLINDILEAYNNKIEQLFTPYNEDELAQLKKLLEKLPL